MPLVPPYIKELQNYKPGKPISEAKRDLGINDIIKLASNENPQGPSPKAIEAMHNSMHNLHRYPDSLGFDLRNKIAKKFSVKIDNVILGAGSEGIMSTIMRTFLLNDDELLSAKNSFIGFRVLAMASGRKINWVPMQNYHYDLEKMALEISDYTKIIYIANPDNPMGTYITKKEFEDFYPYVPDRTLIILDEAYFEYAIGQANYPDSMNYRYDNIITLRSFSKAYGLGGVRIGYGLAHEDLIQNLLKVKVPFEPSLLAQVAGIAALDDTKFLSKTIELNQKGRKLLTTEFERLGIEYIPSAANFITTIWKSESIASNLSLALLKKGIIVRQLTSFGWPNCIRISIGLTKENKRLIQAIEELL